MVVIFLTVWGSTGFSRVVAQLLGIPAGSVITRGAPALEHPGWPTHHQLVTLTEFEPQPRPVSKCLQV